MRSISVFLTKLAQLTDLVFVPLSHLHRAELGSTMGSHKDLIDATRFLAEHRIVPIVSHVLDGLQSAEQGFELMKRGEQFGKIVIKVEAKPAPSAKL